MADDRMPNNKAAEGVQVPEEYLSNGEFWGLSWIQQVEALKRIATLTASLDAKERECERLKAANELDRRSLFAVVRVIDEEITGRMWLLEGRGSYEWDDDRYRQEFGWAVHALQEKLEPLRKIAGDLTNCPETEKGVDSVRKMEAALAEVNKRVEQAYRWSFEDCRAQALHVVDEHDGFSARIGFLEPTLTELARTREGQPEGEK